MLDMKIGPICRSLPMETRGYHVFFHMFPYLQCEAPKIAKLVYNSNNYGLWYL